MRCFFNDSTRRRLPLSGAGEIMRSDGWRCDLRRAQRVSFRGEMTSSEGDDGGKKQPREEEFRATGEKWLRFAVRLVEGGGDHPPVPPPHTRHKIYKGRGFDQGRGRGAEMSRLNVDSSQCLTASHLRGSIWVGIHLLPVQICAWQSISRDLMDQ